MTVPNTNDSETQAVASSPRRPWWKLHFSTKVVIAIVVLGLVLANVPGQAVMHVDVPDQGKYRPHYSPYSRYEHGWPVSYMTRGMRKIGCWSLNEEISEFKPLKLGLNIAVALLLIGASTRIFESWRRRRKSFLRFRLIELFGFMTLVAVVGARIQYKIRMIGDEQNALREARADLEKRFPQNLYQFYKDAVYQHGGPTFLREMAGNYDPFSAFDYVVSADIIDENPRFADRLQQLKCIAPHAHDDSDEDWPQAVANLHNLESLDLVSSGMWNLSDYPPLPKLRRIRNFDSESERDLEWMAKCSNLEQIEMDDVSIGDEGLKKLLNLKNLKSLSVGGRYGQHEFSEECFALIAQLDSLEELSLKGRFRGDNVEALLRLKKLRSLHLDSPKIRPATLKRLENFGHLTWLGVFCRNVSKNDIEKLQAALPNCKVDGPDR